MSDQTITVVGSVNMDFVALCDQFPDSGQTVFGNDFLATPGGKGANQAVAFAKLGGDVKFVGCVGDDDTGRQLLENMRNYQIDTSGIKVCENVTSGIAQISVDGQAHNKIIVVRGANSLVDKQCIDNSLEMLSKSSFIICQHEIPMSTNEYLLEQAVGLNVPVILNPAPAHKLRDETVRKVEILIPNEHEASILTNLNVVDIDSGFKACEQLFLKGVKNVILTMGARGSLLYNADCREHIQSCEVDAVDTTAAGDTFIGALAWYSVYRRYDLREAIEFATKAAAISVTRRGAQISMPELEEVEAL